MILDFNAKKEQARDLYDAAKAKEENTVGKRLAELRHNRGLSLSELSDALIPYGLDIGRAGISRWEMGGTVPGAYQLLALCDFYGIDDMNAFLTDRYPLNEEGRRKLLAYRNDLIASGKYAPKKEARYITMPIQLMGLSAGPGNFLDQDTFEDTDVPADSVPEGADFGVRVSGHSMEPVYPDGSIVWIKKCETLNSGEVGIFVLDGEGYIKMYHEQQTGDGTGIQPFLISYNKAYAPIRILPTSTFTIAGKVL